MAVIKDYKELRIKNTPNNTFKAQVIVDGKRKELVITTRYREVCKYWTMDVRDAAGNDIVVNVPLLSGTNILDAFKHLNLGSVVLWDFANTGKAAANAAELGNDVKMFWGSSV